MGWKQARQHARLMERLRAQHEAAEFENYLTAIVSLHKECGVSWDWEALAKAPEPEAARIVGGRESASREEASKYKPGFFDKLFGNDKIRRAELDRIVADAARVDTEERVRETAKRDAAVRLWESRRRIGTGVASRTPSAYREALEHVEPFADLDAFGAKILITASEADAIDLLCQTVDPELVPTEEVKLTAGGKVSTKEMPAGRYWALYQDYLASMAIRVMRETFAVLPVSRVVVNAGGIQLNTSTGHNEPVTQLAIHFERSAVAKVNFGGIDPSDSLKNFQHRMKFKKTAGFEPVEPITLDEQWITAG